MKTKIICTIGPSSDSDIMIRNLINSGMSITRLNFSHNVGQYHIDTAERIRKWSKKLNKKVEILCDLQGPKIRIGNLPNPPIKLESRQIVTFTTDKNVDYSKKEIPIVDDHLHSDLSDGDKILIDDGRIELKVERIEGRKIFAKVVNPGDLNPQKGINVPETETTTSSITEKDKKDLETIKKIKPDWIAISFVQRPEDVNIVRHIAKDLDVKIMAKIEKPQAIKNLPAILKVTDGIMVARGDLGVEIPIEKLPITQKDIIKRSNRAKNFVVTATQMLDSMTNAKQPTRAEATDVANAIIDGSDAVMLSNETAVGNYPVLALETMAKIAKETDNYLGY